MFFQHSNIFSKNCSILGLNICCTFFLYFFNFSKKEKKDAWTLLHFTMYIFSAICKLKKDSGRCYGYNDAYYFNPEKNMCEHFVYGGCGGNANRFSSRKQCHEFCGGHISNGSHATELKGKGTVFSLSSYFIKCIFWLSPSVYHWALHDSNSFQIFSTFLSILTDLNTARLWTYPNVASCVFVSILRFIMGGILILMYPNFFCS